MPLAADREQVESLPTKTLSVYTTGDLGYSGKNYMSNRYIQAWVGGASLQVRCAKNTEKG
jgi:hypothetical protein